MHCRTLDGRPQADVPQACSGRAAVVGELAHCDTNLITMHSIVAAPIRQLHLPLTCCTDDQAHEVIHVG